MLGRKPRVRLLYVTANADEAKAAKAELRPHGYGVEIVGAACDGAEALQRTGFDAMIVSHPLPDADVIGACATLAQVPGAPPMIVLDGLDRSEEIARTVPLEMRPAFVLLKPGDLPKLPERLAELFARMDDAAFVAPPACDRLARTLAEIARTRETGVLELTAEGVCTRIYLRDGEPVSTEGGQLRETLGRMLLRQGAISEADYVRVIERMTESIMDNEHQRMGEVLVELGLMTSSEVYAALSSQVIEKITSCFGLRQFDAYLVEMDELPAGLEAFQIPPLQALVLEGLGEHADPADLEAQLRRDATRCVRLSDDVTETARRFALEGTELRKLGELDGTRTVGALLDGGLRPPLLAALLWTGAAVHADPRAPDARRAATPPRGRPEFAREVVLPRKRKAPPAAPPMPRAGLPEAEAPEVLSAGEAPTRDSQTRLEAEQHFRRAQSLLEAERFAEAVAVIRRVVELQPLEPEYRMVEAWANYLNARVEMRVARAKAAACARKAAEADPRAAKPHAILGRLAAEDGEHERARKEFEAALVRNPEDGDALRGLKLVRGGGGGSA